MFTPYLLTRTCWFSHARQRDKKNSLPWYFAVISPLGQFLISYPMMPGSPGRQETRSSVILSPPPIPTVYYKQFPSSLGSPPPLQLRMLGMGTRVQDSQCRTVRTVRHVADRFSWLSWPLLRAGRAPFVVSPLERQVESLSRRYLQPGRRCCGAGTEPSVHSIRQGNSLAVVAHAQSLPLSAFPRPRPSLSSLPWEQVRP